MALTYTTLEYSGLEQTLADWGLEEASCTLKVVNNGIDTFRAGMPKANLFDDPVFPFEGQIIIRTGRASGDGSDGSFSGGLIEFTGKRMLHVLDGRPEFEGVYYNFGGPGYDVANTGYQQPSNWFLGFDADVPTLAGQLSSDVVLFYVFTLTDGVPAFTRITTGGQINLTLQHVLDMYSAQGLGAPFQIGTIDVNVPLMPYALLDVKCSEVIEYCLRPSPDARLWFDYTTSPPTANVTSRANCTPVTKALADGVSHESLQITRRDDLVARSVVIFFKETNRVDNTSWIQKVSQKYGPNGLNSGLDPDGGLRVVVNTCDVQGFSVSDVYGQLSTLAVANTRAFWGVIVPEFASTRIRNLTLSNLQAKDETGTAVDLGSYPNVLMDGSSICPWMTLSDSTPVVGKRVTLTADASYKEFDVEGTGGDPTTATNGIFLGWYARKQITWRGTLTNGVTGDYSALASASWADSIPTNIAQLVYQSLATPQFEGPVTFVQREISGGLNMGNVLNLSGGRAEWLAMNAQIESIVKEFGTGRITVDIGPQQYLRAAGLTALFLMNRYRRTFSNPQMRANALSSSSNNSVTLGGNAPKENTNVGLPERQFLAQVLKDDSGNQSALIQHDTQELLTRTPDSPSGLTGATRVMMPRRVHYNDANDGNDKFSIMQSSPPCPDNDEINDTIDDIFIGGGGGGVMMCKITSIHSDYLGVKKWNGTAVSGEEFWVAKAIEFRQSITTASVDGVTLTYTYIDDNHRNSTDGTTIELEVIYPRYQSGFLTSGSIEGVIWVKPADGTLVTVSGTPVKYLEDKPARVWAREYAT